MPVFGETTARSVSKAKRRRRKVLDICDTQTCLSMTVCIVNRSLYKLINEVRHSKIRESEEKKMSRHEVI